jgi:hypothetical protein
MGDISGWRRAVISILCVFFLAYGDGDHWWRDLEL